MAINYRDSHRWSEKTLNYNTSITAPRAPHSNTHIVGSTQILVSSTNPKLWWRYVRHGLLDESVINLSTRESYFNIFVDDLRSNTTETYATYPTNCNTRKSIWDEEEYPNTDVRTSTNISRRLTTTKTINSRTRFTTDIYKHTSIVYQSNICLRRQDYITGSAVGTARFGPS